MKLIVKDVLCILKQRQWMRAAKAFRFYLELPQNPILAAQLTSLIDMQVNATIAGHDIAPALVVDIPSKGTKFQLVIETCFENQNDIGPKLTALTGEYVPVTLAPLNTTKKEPAVQRGTINPEAIKNLHSMFFKNQMFWQFLEAQTARKITTEAECKAAYKDLLEAKSLTEINQEEFQNSIRSFNDWIARAL